MTTNIATELPADTRVRKVGANDGRLGVLVGHERGERGRVAVVLWDGMAYTERVRPVLLRQVECRVCADNPNGCVYCGRGGL